MSYFTIKIIALCSMLIDHLGYFLLDNNQSMRIIGRIAFPLFCFLLVNGYFHTKNKMKYLLRMTVFAILSEPCFDFCIYMGLNMNKQNVFFTLVLGLISLMITEKYIGIIVDKINFIPKNISIFIGSMSILVGFMMLNIIIRADYGWYGILLIHLFYWTYGSTKTHKTYMSIALVVANFMRIVLTRSIFQIYSILAIPILMMFKDINVNVPKRVKILCYAFYPAHLVLIGLVKFIMYV